ncbi:MAG: ATP-binding cassette domain-containing protein [Pseudomonadota bacterium]
MARACWPAARSGTALSWLVSTLPWTGHRPCHCARRLVGRGGQKHDLRLLSRLHDPQEGRVTLDGRDLRDLRLGGLRASVARVSQDVFLFDATVHEVIVFGKSDATRAEVEAAARAGQAHDFVVRLPNGYDTRVGERGVRLSGGQKQRLSIA